MLPTYQGFEQAQNFFSLRRHPPETLLYAFLKAPCAPSCHAARDIAVQATVSGLVPGAKYNILHFVQRAPGRDLVHVAAEQVTRQSLHDEPAYSVRLAMDIPPLQTGSYVVGAIVYDSFPGLDGEEAFLTQCSINVVVAHMPHPQ